MNFLKNNEGLIVKEIGERNEMTTNNKMELQAIISAFEYLNWDKPDPSFEFNIYTDSRYVVTGAKSWIFGWQKNGWITSAKEGVKNKELWEALYNFIHDKKIKWCLLPGHAGVVGNERCDEIATGFADNIYPNLFFGEFKKYDNPKILDIFYDPELIDIAKSNKKIHSKKSPGKKAYSYISKVDGIINIDSNWADCEKRVKGKKGTLYKKAMSLGDQEIIIGDFKAR